MSWNQHEVLEARRAIFETAKGIAAGTISTVEGARAIVRHRCHARLEDDPDILPFVGIASETDALPIGEERKHWQAQTLADLQSRSDDAEAWARKIAIPYCQSLLARSTRLMQWP